VSDFGGLKGIVEEARQLEREERAKPLVDCPVCGTPLDKNSRGEVNCPMGHFRQSSDVRRNEHR
jgi:hypothetical protein